MTTIPTTTTSRTDAVAAIAELAAIPNANRYAERMLESAREHLARYDARPFYWTAEHYRIALRDAVNAARLGIRYTHDEAAR